MKKIIPYSCKFENDNQILTFHVRKKYSSTILSLPQKSEIDKIIIKALVELFHDPKLDRIMISIESLENPHRSGTFIYLILKIPFDTEVQISELIDTVSEAI